MCIYIYIYINYFIFIYSLNIVKISIVNYLIFSPLIKPLKLLGTESSECVTCIMEPWTNRTIDFQATEKCFGCIDHNTPDTYCQFGLFHGPTGNMEVHNALLLFRRSVDLGLRY